MMGFASDKAKVDEPFVVPRQIAGGNLKLCGVLLSYAQPEVATFVKQAMGFNFLPRELGERITSSVVEMALAGRIRPVVGSVIGFEDLPGALTAMANRETVGRVIAILDH
jgi:NADPH:quinone reductase-like Zn-dependent oxidoreductase